MGFNSQLGTHFVDKNVLIYPQPVINQCHVCYVQIFVRIKMVYSVSARQQIIDKKLLLQI